MPLSELSGAGVFSLPVPGGAVSRLREDAIPARTVSTRLSPPGVEATTTASRIAGSVHAVASRISPMLASVLNPVPL
jgi:hypothetical protein